MNASLNLLFRHFSSSFLWSLIVRSTPTYINMNINPPNFDSPASPPNRHQCIEVNQLKLAQLKRLWVTWPSSSWFAHCLDTCSHLHYLLLTDAEVWQVRPIDWFEFSDRVDVIVVLVNWTVLRKKVWRWGQNILLSPSAEGTLFEVRYSFWRQGKEICWSSLMMAARWQESALKQWYWFRVWCSSTLK